MAIRLVTYRHSEDVPPLPGNDIFYSTDVFRLLERTTDYDVMLIVAYDGDCIIGKLLAVTRNTFKYLRFWKKTIVFGTGEYFSDGIKSEDIFSEMISYLVALKKDDTMLFEFRNLEESLFGYKYFRENKFFPVRWLRVINSIHYHHFDQWMSQSRKKQISRALAAGAELCEATSVVDIKAAFRMMKHYYTARPHNYFPDFSFFNALMSYRAEHDLGKMFLVKYKGKIIGCSACIFSGDKAFLLFVGGMNKSYPLLHPCALAVWKAMLYSHSKGFRYFEFINAGLPFRKWGYRDFILRFGGKQLSSRRWFRLNCGWLNNLLIKLYI